MDRIAELAKQVAVCQSKVNDHKNNGTPDIGSQTQYILAKYAMDQAFLEFNKEASFFSSEQLLEIEKSVSRK